MFVFTAAIHNLDTASILLVVLAFINTVISLYYYLLVVKAMFITPNNQPVEPFQTEGYLKTSILLSLAGIVLIGILSFFYQQISLASFGL
jgi:NADH-quinone oxidoreductase subunit N